MLPAFARSHLAVDIVGTQSIFIDLVCNKAGLSCTLVNELVIQQEEALTETQGDSWRRAVGEAREEMWSSTGSPHERDTWTPVLPPRFITSRGAAASVSSTIIICRCAVKWAPGFILPRHLSHSVKCFTLLFTYLLSYSCSGPTNTYKAPIYNYL